MAASSSMLRHTGVAQLARRGAGVILIGTTLLVGLVITARADTLRVYAAGSLAGAMKDLIAASGLPAAAVATPVFGPAGLLRQRIEAGEHADLFASADMAQAQAVADKGLGFSPVPYARNKLCVVARKALAVSADNLLDKLLDPAVRLATSTPVADPGGDYAWAVFKRGETLRPGAEAILQAKALKLLGSPGAMVPVAGHSPGASIFLADRADALLYYCSGVAALLSEAPDLASLPLPPSLEVDPVYGLTVRDSNPDALRLALFMLSAQGQAILVRNGLLPVGLVIP